MDVGEPVHGGSDQGDQLPGLVVDLIDGAGGTEAGGTEADTDEMSGS